ncbi:wall-associated receptor kinase-like 14 isoform X2 [Dioscorea cayenensis subsp. rotundata]|uniref:Wall-associated receptor kinase-like 14 isoform X2 n=1 Tax=Dioscorea cayennensis subsp. rotundata TaxID=55577 RepID=A0AB40CM06_DIOCR|nr:wall-associated receptor kinase-like 14 isoform X2 [Dioscorea cayenensis subsp. rotundata]
MGTGRGLVPLRLVVLMLLLLLFSCDQTKRTCGSNTVPYPFGFFKECKIPLKCNNNSNNNNNNNNNNTESTEIMLGDFVVSNITWESFQVDVPPSCNRSIRTATSFFGSNYAMTWNNMLFLRNCNVSGSSGCSISTALLSHSLNLNSCAPSSPSSGNDNISCFPSNDTAKGFLSPDNILKHTGCQSLFTSGEYDTTDDRFTSLVFRHVELGWWLDGDCHHCDPNADCTRLQSPVTRGNAIRCRCKEGFQGDGFIQGDACRKETRPSCNPSHYMSGKCGGTTRVGVLIGGIILGACIMAGLAFVIYIIRRRSSLCRMKKSMRRLLSEASCAVPLYSYKDIERATMGFAASGRLGNGAYGTVYAGKLNNGDLVAVKRIKHREADGMEQVMNEIKLLSSVSHPNLVQLLGCCIERGEQILVYEFMPNGTLSQQLQRERGDGLPWTVRLTIATETAQAIAYLHSSVHPPIYHRDVKSSNILLDYNYNSKVADFGLSRVGITGFSHISTAPQGTPGYLDPQYHQSFHLSDKSDVYSFGVVLVEIITGLKVVDFSRVPGEVNLAALAIDKIGRGLVEEIIDPFLEPHRDAWTLSSIHKVAELAFRCLAFHRDMRPSMMEVAEELDQIKLSGWAATDERNIFLSSSSSLCSASSSIINISSVTPKKCASASSNMSISVIDATVQQEVQVVDSPVSVHDRWFSDQSSPSANSLLANVRHS